MHLLCALFPESVLSGAVLIGLDVLDYIGSYRTFRADFFPSLLLSSLRID